jgi:hypothetical protein
LAKKVLVALSALLLAIPKRAYAYVDPGSGSMLWQVTAAGLIGSLFYVRQMFAWVRERLGFLKTSRQAGTKDSPGANPDCFARRS